MEATLDALDALGISPKSPQDVSKGLKNAWEVYSPLSTKEYLRIAKNASAGKYGIPFKFVSAIIGTWVNAERKMQFDKKRGQL